MGTKDDGRQAFTLIELLGVLTIMAILMAVTIPSFKGIGTNAKLNSAVNKLRSSLSLTRQWAITHHQNAYLIAEESGSNAFKAFAVIGGTNMLADWVLLTEGLFLDPGPIGDNIYDLDDVYTNEAGLEYSGVRFKPNGSPGKESSIYIAEGVQPNPGDAPVITKTNNRTRINIRSMTGLIKVERDF